MDDASGFFASTGDPNFPQDSNNLLAEYALSSFDIRHRFSTSFSAELPFGPGKTMAHRIPVVLSRSFGIWNFRASSL
jgi:hypothetical protein